MTRLGLGLAVCLLAAACRGEALDDVDADGYVKAVDCDDSDPAVHPTAPEVCNGVDDDCSGGIDDTPTDAPDWYVDVDGDGIPGTLSTTPSCAQPVGASATPDDCDDLDRSVHPGAVEICNDIDDDCDDQIDDADEDVDLDTQRDVWVDADADGYGDDAATPVLACATPDGYAAEAGDCDDAAELVHPGAPEVCNEGVDDDCNGVADDDDRELSQASTVPFYVDRDGDGYGGIYLPIRACVAPEGTTPEALDCDDFDPRISPDAAEICNGRDDDCDTRIDDDDDDLDTTGAPIWVVDADGDGHGAIDGATVAACVQPADTAPEADDCDDDSDTVHPGAVEVCNDGVDDDCDGAADDADTDVAPTSTAVFYVDRDHDGYGGSYLPIRACAPPAGTTVEALDCDDFDPRISPDAAEICNARDDDCDTKIDDLDDDLDVSAAPIWTVDADGDGHGAIGGQTVAACARPTGTAAVADDCDDDRGDVHPGAAEVCNGGVDDDCNGGADDGDRNLDLRTATRFWSDRDGDGYGGTWFSLLACEGPEGLVANALDCDDDDDSRSPAATEVCNDYDDDCDSAIDDDDDSRVGGDTWYGDLDDDGWGAAGSSLVACVAPEGYGTEDRDCNDGDDEVHPGATEVCNTIDDDCNDRIDDQDPGLDPSGGGFYRDNDHDGWGTLAARACADFGFGWADKVGDCNDTLADVHPGAPETCNGRNDDCDGQTDEDAVDATDYYVDGDRDGYGSGATIRACSAGTGRVTQSGDCDDVLASVYPGATEVCNLRDDDCDGTVDLDTPNLPMWYVDGDGDGWGVTSSGLAACASFSGRVAKGGDCDDLVDTVHPTATEVLDGVDNDCDGNVDFPTPIDGGYIDADVTWGNPDPGGPGIPGLYQLGTSVIVTAGHTLTVEKCTRILVSPGQTIQIEGTLIARGTPECPIVFTSAKASPAKGDWARIFFTSSATGGEVDGDGDYVSGSVFENVALLYSGGTTAAVVVAGAGEGSWAPAMLGVHIAFSAGSGISSNAQRLFVRDSLFEDNTSAGISTGYQYNVTTLLDSTFRRNGTGASLSGGCCGAHAHVEGNLFERNGSGFSANGDYNEWTFVDNRFLNNSGTGLNAFNAPGRFEGNWFVGNRTGLSIGYSGSHDITGNVFADNSETAITSQYGGQFTLTGNVFVRNRDVYLSGNWEASPTVFEDNLFQAHTGTSNPLIRLPQQTAGSPNPSRLRGNVFIGPLNPTFLDVGFRAGSGALDAKDNWWDGLPVSGANGVVRDFFDDAALAVVALNPVATVPNTDAPISMPTGLALSWEGDVATLAWGGGPEADLAGYRVYYGLERDLWAMTGAGAPEGDSGFEVGEETATVSGLDPALPWRFAVTAVDADADGSDDLRQGHESWFAIP